MTINSTAIILLALYVAVARRQGVPEARLSGTVQNDILKEYVARGTYIYPPRPSLRIVTDIFAFCERALPNWNSISISGYHIRETGATAVQEVAFTFANAIAYVEAARAAGLDVNTLRDAHLVLLQRAQRFLRGDRQVSGGPPAVGADHGRALRRDQSPRAAAALPYPDRRLPRAGGWPVVLFSTGYGLERQLYTGLVEDLASHGYVVVAIDHPHDANIVAFPDGHTVSIGNVGRALTRSRRRSPSASPTPDTCSTRSPASTATAERALSAGCSTSIASACSATPSEAPLPPRRCSPTVGSAQASTWMAVSSARSRPRVSRGRSCSSPPTRVPQQPKPRQFWNHLTGPRYAVDFTGPPTSRSPTSSFWSRSWPAPTGPSKRRAPTPDRHDQRTVAYTAERTHVLAFFDHFLKRKPGSGAVLALSKKSEPPIAEGAGLKRFSINEGSSVMNWIRRAWRFIVDRPLHLQPERNRRIPPP